MATNVLNGDGWLLMDIIMLVGGFNPSEKYEFVNWDDDSQYMEKYKSCSKPPTSHPNSLTKTRSSVLHFSGRVASQSATAGRRWDSPWAESLGRNVRNLGEKRRNQDMPGNVLI